MKLPNNFKETWSIKILAGDSPLTLDVENDQSISHITRKHVIDTPTLFVADPFMIRVKGVWYLFMEILNAETNLGEIALVKSVDGIKWEYQQVVLKEDYHLSYPFVFEDEGDFYMVLETLDAHAIRLYKSNCFPFDWKHIVDLTQGKFADPTLMKQGNYWWLFAASRPYKHDTLNLFYADNLMGPYTEHPKSPIVQNDNQAARPAGRISKNSGKLIRLCQDCYPKYGTGVRAFEIIQLDTKEYIERELMESPILGKSKKDKQWNSHGMHHIDAHQIGPNKWIACVDGCYDDRSNSHP